MNIFVTGTDTGVGKTVISAILALKFGYRYWKPIQCGTNEPTDSKWVAERIGNNFLQKEVYNLKAPLAPYFSAQLEHKDISIESILDEYPKDQTVIEGCGGTLVPINKNHFIIDFIGHLGCPTILIARSGLGTINHTLLSLEALKSRSLRTLGVILVGDLNLNNKNAIEKFGKIPVVGQIPILKKLDRKSLIEVSDLINLEE
jgi:malonyl-CoA O-methyltransferase